MPLPSSGPLSLNDIAGEFGGSTPHSLSEYYAGGGLVPAGTTGTYGAVPSSGTISIQNFYGTSNVVLWLNSLSGTNDTFGYRVAVDSSSNVYILGVLFVSSVYRAYLAKFNSSGTLQWQTGLFQSGLTLRGPTLGVDSSGNVYAGFQPYYFAKYNSSGTLQWQVVLGGGVGGGNTSFTNFVDSSGNTFVSNLSNARVLKINSSGGVDWTAENFASGSFAFGAGSSGGDPAGNNYYAVMSEQPNSNFLIHKYNSSGTLQWMRTFSPVIDNSCKVTADSSNNVYLAALSARFSGTTYLVVAKLDSSGVVTWSSVLSGPAVSSFGVSRLVAVAVDTNGDVYATMNFASPDTTVLLVKYNSSGTLQWARTIDPMTLGDSPWGAQLALDSQGIYVTGTNANGTGTRFLTIKLPKDGSKTGSWTVSGTTVTVSSYSVSASSFGLSTSSIGSSPSSFSSTSSSSSLTAYTPTQTSTTTTI